MLEAEKISEASQSGAGDRSRSFDGDEPTTGRAEQDGSPVAGPASGVAPPNGGFVAWLQVAGSFALYFNTL